jgi:chemotaxis protein histidine kinase CheA
MADIAQGKQSAIDRMSIRIEHLDSLLSLAGEVIITSSNLHDLQRQLQQCVVRAKPMSDEDLEGLRASNEASRRISQDLHNLVMAIRLVEIGDTLRLFRRPVRDLCRNLGREVDLHLDGMGTMIDKALAERLVDPILHMLRNAIDHGIESPLERSKTGKEPKGRVCVTAIDQEHHTEITVSDDGRGIDGGAILDEAAKLGLIAPDAQLPILNVLSLPGFSTRTEATATSGRGVGLDLVRTMVEEFGGTMDMDTKLGQGTSITLHVPKLRAVNIVDALTVRAGIRAFALPITCVVASVGIDAATIQTVLGSDNRYIKYLGEIIVLHDLQQILGDPPAESIDGSLPVLIIEGKNGRVALLVSEFLGPKKLVNVPLNSDVFHVPGVAGTFVHTGGKLGLTLDVDALVNLATGKEDDDSDAVQAGPSFTAQLTADETAESTDGSAGSPESKEETKANLAAIKESDAAALAEELKRSLDEMQDSLLNLEATPDDPDLLNEAFRRLHASKGNFTMLEADAAADLAHRVETILDYIRSGRVPSTTERIDLILDSVTWMKQAADSLPAQAIEPPHDLRDRLQDEYDAPLGNEPEANDGDLIGRTFELSPTMELQVLSAIKRGEHTYETLINFHPGRQSNFLVAYLILRRLGTAGSVLATLPTVDEIERGECGRAIKVLWSTPLDEEGVQTQLNSIARSYGVTESHSIPTTIFRYERATE